jgi:hypothetical protein
MLSYKHSGIMYNNNKYCSAVSMCCYCKLFFFSFNIHPHLAQFVDSSEPCSHYSTWEFIIPALLHVFCFTHILYIYV